MDKFVLKLGVLVFGLVAVASRLVPHEYNFAAFGAFSIFCGCYLRGVGAWIVPLAAYAISESLGRMMGLPSMSSQLLLFVLLGYALSASAGILLRFLNQSPRSVVAAVPSLACVLGVSLLGSMAFFVVTNFASWLDPRMQYPQTLAGLIHCYGMGIPFYRPTLVSDVAFGQVFFVSYYAAQAFLGSQSRKPIDNV